MVKPLHNFQINLTTLELKARKRVYTVWLVASDSDDWKMYYCPDCRNALCKYKGDAVMEIPGEAPRPYPVQIMCRNPNCGRIVVFENAVKQLEAMI